MVERSSTINYINHKYTGGNEISTIDVPISVLNRRSVIRTSVPNTQVYERTIPQITERRVVSRGVPVGIIPGRINSSQVGRV